MTTVALTERQHAVYHALSAEPQTPKEIEAVADLQPGVATGVLLSLRGKGLARKHFNPTRWSKS